MNDPGLEIFTWPEDGYQPLVFHAGWQVALLNWESIFDPKNIGEIERHAHTDEVFILWRGQATLFISDLNGLQAEVMQPGLIYNVRQGTWHNLIATRDASFIIVENRDTHLHDTEIRQMTAEEKHDLLEYLPDWAFSSPLPGDW